MRARFATALGLLALVAAPAVIGVAGAAPASAAPATALGGVDLGAQATLVTVRLLGLAGQPSTELGFASTSATAGSGAVNQASASWLRKPSAAAPVDLGALLGGPGQTPAGQVDARNPGGPPEQRQELAPGSGMAASAGAAGARSDVSVVGLAPPQASSPGLLPGLPLLPALPLVPGELTSAAGLVALVDANAVSSTSELTEAPNAVTSLAHTSATGVALLGGLIGIDAVDVRSSAASNGQVATADGASTLTGITVAGQRLPVDATAVPQPISDTLGTAGITVTMAPADRQVSGAAGTMRAGSMTVGVDTNLLRGSLGGLLTPLQGLLPSGLLGTLNPVLALAPRLEFVVGDALASAKAAAPGTGQPVVPGAPQFPGFQLPAFPVLPRFPLTSFPPFGSIPGGGFGRPAPHTAAQGQAPAASVAPANAASIAALAPVPRILLAGGLAFAAVLGWALQRGGGFLLNGVGSCPHGLATGVPDLRQGLPSRSDPTVDAGPPSPGTQPGSPQAASQQGAQASGGSQAPSQQGAPQQGVPEQGQAMQPAQQGSSWRDKLSDAADRAREHLKRGAKSTPDEPTD